MARERYAALADVYDWLVPDQLLEPSASVAAFADPVRELEPGARVLDCAAGTGTLAVGLALEGFDVAATDASDAMIRRTRELAADHHVALDARTCAWDELAEQGWDAAFAAVFCVGNSLVHAVGEDGRRRALRAMAGVLRDRGLLVLTSRNWERLREERPILDVSDRVIERKHGKALTAYAWSIPESWETPHELEIVVALLQDSGGIELHGERLAFWPFTHAALLEDIRAAGLEPLADTYADGVERYLVTARALRPLRARED